jgi:hypothetical protein
MLKGMQKPQFILGPDVQIDQGGLQHWYRVTCRSAYLAHNVSDLQHAQHGPMGYRMFVFLNHEDIAIRVCQSLSLLAGESEKFVDIELDALAVCALGPEASQHWH